MIKAIVADDEWYNLEEISELIEKTGLMTVEKKYQNPLKVIEDVEDICPQVAFIDIEMPEMDGITLAEKLLEKQPSMIIVFITAWDKYAIQAFDVNAFDYILKPIKIDRFNKTVQRIKNEIESKKVYSKPAIKIKCFDRFETSIGGIPVKWMRAKAEELFAYLLMNYGSYIHKDEIIEELWSGYAPDRALPILQTSVCKIRNIFSDVKHNIYIEYSGNSYCLYVKDAECDYFEFKEALKQYILHNRNTYYYIERACNIFGRGFLSQQDYIWSIEKDEELRNKLVGALQEIVSDYLNIGDNAETIKFLKYLAVLVPYDDEINYRLLKLLKSSGSNSEFIKQYEWLQKVLMNEYGTVPSEKIEKLYKSKKF